MADVDKYEILVLGSGEAGKYLAWTMAKEGHRTAMVERKWLGGRALTSHACRARI
jgi:pyruvate/2-oxoglutarate dehydrogenase complex dihydrolipoamide dehydrogenase (E3) component